MQKLPMDDRCYTTASSQQGCSLSVALQMAARASTAAACRAYRAKRSAPKSLLLHSLVCKGLKNKP